MEKTTQTNKYFLHFEAFFSNWLHAHFKDKNSFIMLHPYKQTKNNMFYYSSIDKKQSVCRFNDIEMIKNDFFSNPYKYFNMALYEVDKNTYFEALELLKKYSEFKKDDLQIFKDFYNRIEKDFENILK